MVAQQFTTMKNRCSIFHDHIIVVYGWTCTFQDVVKKYASNFINVSLESSCNNSYIQKLEVVT